MKPRIARWTNALIAALMNVPGLPAQEAVTRDVDLDHLIVQVPSLARGIAEFTRLTGVIPQRGGQHPGRGTENALVSLGPGRYLELLAPISAPADTAGSVGLRLVGWAIHTRALRALLGRTMAAGFDMNGPTPGSRRKPDGTLLEWQTAALAGDELPLAPFAIEWGPAVPHPSSTSPGGCRLVSFVLETPEAAGLLRFLRAVGHEATVRNATTSAMRVELACPTGTVTLST